MENINRDQEKTDQLAEAIRRFGDAVAWAEFVIQVSEMRHAQIMFFRTREQKWLTESKRLEKTVDGTIAKFREKQTKLF